MEYILKTA